MGSERRRKKVLLCDIRRHLGCIIGQRVLEVTAGDPPAVPDASESDEKYVQLMFEDGTVVAFNIQDSAFWVQQTMPSVHKARRRAVKKKR